MVFDEQFCQICYQNENFDKMRDNNMAPYDSPSNRDSNCYQDF